MTPLLPADLPREGAACRQIEWRDEAQAEPLVRLLMARPPNRVDPRVTPAALNVPTFVVRGANLVDIADVIPAGTRAHLDEDEAEYLFARIGDASIAAIVTGHGIDPDPGSQDWCERELRWWDGTGSRDCCASKTSSTGRPSRIWKDWRTDSRRTDPNGAEWLPGRGPIEHARGTVERRSGVPPPGRTSAHCTGLTVRLYLPVLLYGTTCR
jgi:hypothetical protein